MNQELINRVQENIAKVDKLKVAKIEAETKIKSLEESIEEDLAKAKELGYNSYDELIAAKTQLEESIKKECDEVEAAFTSMEV